MEALTNAQKRLLGDRSKYMGGNPVDLPKIHLNDFLKTEEMFGESKILSFDLKYSPEDLNWNAVNYLENPARFHKFIEVIDTIGVLDPGFENIVVHGIKIEGHEGGVLPPPAPKTGSRILFNLADPGSCQLTTDPNGDGFYVRKYYPRNTVALLGNSQHVNYSLCFPRGKYVFRHKIGKDTVKSDRSDFRIPKRKEYSRIVWIFDIIDPNLEDYADLNQSLEILKKRRTAGAMTSEEKAALKQLQDNLKEIARQKKEDAKE